MIEELQHLRTPFLVAAILSTGLQAGTYYTWASGVMPGLGRADDRTFVVAMQQVDEAIVNPVFLATFLGAPVAAGVAVAVTEGAGRGWAIAGLVASVATVVVTVAGNVPLNNALAAAGDLMGAADLASARESFEGPWVRWNLLRAVTSVGALAALATAALRS